MLTILFLILGTAFSHRGGLHFRCRTEVVSTEQQDEDLVKLLLPFTGAASDGEEGSGETDSGEIATTDSTNCVMRGLSRSWPHEDAEPEVMTRRLLRRGRKNKVKFNVDSQVFGPLSRKNSDGYLCYEDAEVTFSFKNADVTLSTDAETESDDPRRKLRRGGQNGGNHGHNEEEAEPTPYAVLTLQQTNAIPDEDGNIASVSFDMAMMCRPWYKLDVVADGEDETCTLKGINCHDGEYLFFSTDEGEDQEENESFFRGMKCSADEDFHDEWEECNLAATLSD